MHATKKFAENKKILHELVPLNSISPERFAELSEKIIIESVKSGHYLFRKGDRDNQTIFLLEGKISLIDGFRKVAGEIVAGTEQSRHPIANLQPRQYAARATARSVIARVDSMLLDVFLTWDPSNAAEVAEIGAVESGDWMTRMLQSKAFVKLPPSMLQALLMKFKPIEVEKGQVIIAQGSEGDHFYTIHEGRCVVTRREAPDAPEQKLAELGSGDSFGEESLVSESRRNATITMLTDGLLMRLSKDDFVGLLKTQLVQYVDYEEAKLLVDEGAVWVDVRTPDEYENGAFEDSVNIPLSVLRGEMPELVYNAKYVICCDTGSRSDSAAFVLSHRGFDVCVLSGGMASRVLEDVDAQEASDLEPDSVLAESRDVQEIDLLMAELEQERQARQSVVQQLDMVRGELAESGEKLAEYYSRVKQLEEQQLQYGVRYAAMSEKHAEQLQAVSEELDQEKIQSHSLRKSVSDMKSERDALRRELDSERRQSEAQYLNLQVQLDRALARVAEMEHGGVGPQPAVAAPGGGFESENAEIIHLRNVLRSVSGERQLVDDQLQQLKLTVIAMTDSMSRMGDQLSGAGPEEGGDLEG
jgi:CRP-like cAMP-binding protein